MKTRFSHNFRCYAQDPQLTLGLVDCLQVLISKICKLGKEKNCHRFLRFSTLKGPPSPERPCDRLLLFSNGSIVLLAI